MAAPAEDSRRPEKPSATSSKPKKNLNFCGVPSFVTFIVGKEAQKFTVHKNLAEHYSPFFEKAFNSGFVEGQTQEMVLEDVEAGIFGYLVNWLYTKEIIHPDDEEIQLVEFAKLWVLAGRFLIPRLQNKAMQCIRKTNYRIVTEFRAYVKFALKKELEGTQLYRRAWDDLLQKLSGVTRLPICGIHEGLLEYYAMTDIEGGDTAAAIIKRLVIHCAPFLSKHIPPKPIEDYFVEEGDARIGD
ncbi:hypothetical protein LAWI1_G005964 [Lachnellula willkommii]|uniref:BTB domain-containing protein n=1 Tax=Lachnellula willkommii TaxID=215461 RepID=A0A559M8A1_9HELO|nr:hypothetical protein LAWI1_G005964 [Lachnellula willkommii]